MRALSQHGVRNVFPSRTVVSEPAPEPEPEHQSMAQLISSWTKINGFDLDLLIPAPAHEAKLDRASLRERLYLEKVLAGSIPEFILFIGMMVCYAKVVYMRVNPLVMLETATVMQDTAFPASKVHAVQTHTDLLNYVNQFTDVAALYDPLSTAYTSTTYGQYLFVGPNKFESTRELEAGADFSQKETLSTSSVLLIKKNRHKISAIEHRLLLLLDESTYLQHD